MEENPFNKKSDHFRQLSTTLVFAYQVVGMRIVIKSQTAMERRTQLVGDCMPDLLRMMMMMVLEIMVMMARKGIISPRRGYTKWIGPRFMEVSRV